MLQTVPVTMVMMVVMAVIMIVVMVIVPDFEELRLDLQDTVEIEGAAFEHVRQRDLAALGAMQFGIRIDAPDARLDLDRKSVV